MILETIEWHTVHPRFFNAASTVIDLGANIGSFSHKMIERFGCRCFAVEPSPEIFKSISPHEKLETFNLAVCGKNGPVAFYVSDNPEASSVKRAGELAIVETITVQGKTLEAFCAELDLDVIDIVKMDIEGAEIEVIDACSNDFLINISQMTVEFHDFCGLVRPADIKRVFSRLKKLGFYSIRMSGNGHLDTLLINRRRCWISMAECMWIEYAIRNWAGFKRVLRRRFLSARK